MYIYSNNNGTGISLFHLRMITIFTKVHTSLSSEFPHICIKSFQFPLSTLAHTQTFDTQIPKPWILYRLSESHTTIIIWNGRLWPNSCCFFLSSTHRNYLAQLLCLLNSIVDRDRILEDHRGQLCVCRFCSCSQISIPILKYGSHVCKCFRICVTDYVLFSVWSYVRKPTSPDRLCDRSLRTIIIIAKPQLRASQHNWDWASECSRAKTRPVEPVCAIQTARDTKRECVVASSKNCM